MIPETTFKMTCRHCGATGTHTGNYKDAAEASKSLRGVVCASCGHADLFAKSMPAPKAAPKRKAPARKLATRTRKAAKQEEE